MSISGSIDTPMWGMLADSAAQSSDPAVAQNLSAYIAASISGGTLGRPDDVASAIVVLASEKSSYRTGTEIVVDHGIVAG